MSKFDELLSTIDGIEGLTPEQKEAILAPAKALNVEAGKRGSDLIDIKRQLDDANKQNLTYKDLMKTLADNNIQLKDATKLAEKLNIQKTQDDTIDEMKKILKESQDNAKTLAEELRVYKQEKSLGPQFEQAVKTFKDKDGNDVELLPDFVNAVKEDLFKGIKEGDVQEIITDRMNKALLQAYSDQVSFMDRNKVIKSDKPFHRVEEGGLAGSGQSASTGIKGEELRKELVDGGGTVDTAAQIITRLMRESKQ